MKIAIINNSFYIRLVCFILAVNQLSGVIVWCKECTMQNATSEQANLTILSPNPVFVLMTLITYLKWTSVCVIYDNGTDENALELVHQLSEKNIFFVMYHMSEVTASNIDALASTKLKNKLDQIKFTFLCSQFKGSCKSFLEKPFDFDRRSVWRNSLLHSSRWIVSLLDSKNPFDVQRNSSILFDNIAVIHKRDQTMNHYDHNDDKVTKETIISTLLWGVERTRVLLTVGMVIKNGTIRIESDIFPNIKLGFNGRKFMIGSLPWHPFTIFNKKTKQYTGFMIDMLHEISHALNFTYEIRDSVDGKWGAAVDEETNTWNGLIGELQRRDIDLVFAPITINPYRETVMDFSHPFFYEFSAIMLKKPSISDSRWTTLTNIFRPKVLMYTGISLCVVSILLFVFEKYSPYYSRQKRADGLHHFSDSFWYMYGALLTQGGEHMAEAISGRTILTSWWLFCIILAATYSGNFVAFLTVDKEKLPFTNIEELVRQSDYTFGTLGESVYETILKTSDLPERIEFWNKIVELNKTDHSVLSDNVNDHVQKILNSEFYAFIGDKTGIDKALLANCELTTAASDLLPLQYGIGLPNHSPFGQLFSEEIVVILESGLIPLWKRRYLPESAKCQTSNKANQVTIYDIQLAFYLIGIGIGLAGILLFCEFIKRKLQRCSSHQYNGTDRPRGEDGVTVKNVSYISPEVSRTERSDLPFNANDRNNHDKEVSFFNMSLVSPVSRVVERQLRQSDKGRNQSISQRTRNILDVI